MLVPKTGRYLALLTVILCLGATSAFASTKVTMRASQTRVVVGADFSLVVEIETVGARVDKYLKPNLSAFQPIDSKVSEVTTQVGGKVKRTETRTYLLRAKRIGSYSVKGAGVQVGGQRIEASPVTIEVLPGGTKIAITRVIGGVTVPGFVGPESDSTVVFKAITEAKDVFVNQEILVSWLLFSKEPIVRYSAGINDKLLLASQEKELLATYIKTTGQFEEVVIDGETYQVTVVGQALLSQEQIGQWQLPMPKLSVLGQNSGWITSELEREAVTLDVEAKNGALLPVAPLTARVALDKEVVAVGDGLTLSLIVEGTGALRRYKPPAIEIPGAEVEAPAELHYGSAVVGKTVRANARYGYWVRPMEPGQITIPNLAIQYVNPSTGDIEQIDTKQLTLQVGGGMSDQGRELVPMVSHIRNQASWYKAKWWFILNAAIVALGALTLLLVLATYLRRRRDGASPKPAPSPVLRQHKKELKRVARAAKRGDVKQWSHKAKSLLLGHVFGEEADRAGSWTLPQVREELTRQYGPNAVAESISQQVEQFDVLQYGASKVTRQELLSLHFEFVDVLGRCKELSQ